MTVAEIVAELGQLGSESTKRVLMRHGAPEPFYGVKVEDLKKIQKRVRRDHELALGLYETGISDAMYLAGLIAEPARMTADDLRRWAEGATWSMISEYTVPWVASESPHGRSLAVEWIGSAEESIASSGWATYGSLVSITPDDRLDLAEIAGLLDRAAAEIHAAPNRVRYAMNGFVIAVGCYVAPLTDRARGVAEAIGRVEVDMGGTSCKTPLATDAIAKVERRGSLGKKRKQAAC